MASISRIITFAVLILASASLPSVVASSSSTAKRSNPIIINAAPPRISIQQLRSSSLQQQSDSLEQHSAADTDTAASTTSINLHQLLHESHGTLRIAVDGVGNNDVYEFSDLRKRAFSHLCECPALQSTSSSNNDGILSWEALESHPQDLQQITFPDGTVRRTLATASVGFDDNDYSSSSSSALLELPSWVGDECGKDASDSWNELRNVIVDVVDAFVERLDLELRVGGEVGKEEEDEGNYYQQILSSVTHLEHFHLYTKSSSTSSSREDEEEGDSDSGSNAHIRSSKEDPQPPNTLDYHTDAGFFLSFVPAMNCRSRAVDNTSFFLKGQSKSVTFEEDEVVILMGAGAEHWLPPLGQSGSGDVQNEFPFMASSHALRLAPDTHRAWYGKMHLLPSSFAKGDVQALSTTSVSHGEGSHEKVTPNLLQEQYHSQDTVMQTQSLRRHRRKLRHVNSPADCNNQTNLFCWHQCIDVPAPSSNSDGTDKSGDGYSLLCLDPTILASSPSSGSNSLNDATKPCEGGYAHNSKCIPSWQAMMVEDSVPGPVGVDVDSHILGGLFSMTKKGWVVLGLGVFGLVGGAYAVGFAFGSKSEYRRLP
mmetsp:Transcript_31658/g.58581  ORF Transcript_31658/g.58581 Transcript_31658/m.58581 type:complete len:596 (-) Transcript_31658:358-2145(-)|eukprot:CAMPEP_0196139232 /NCGR_PEP_ID=MMETSP0910-20130528/6584_1 /TAXON_ID=49265 /ORGANISM="Thalassiosira rotula, Strain GSO102" /LENGTH=595 /DNA_ID=CAMNT_0041399937 /DNA_START=35 /DNA_END=1822 /DNA_ORIENTATION=+